jgi:hypothetical protein
MAIQQNRACNLPTLCRQRYEVRVALFTMRIKYHPNSPKSTYTHSVSFTSTPLVDQGIL